MHFNEDENESITYVKSNRLCSYFLAQILKVPVFLCKLRNVKRANRLAIGFVCCQFSKCVLEGGTSIIILSDQAVI